MQPQGDIPGDIHRRSFPANPSLHLPVRRLRPRAGGSVLNKADQVLSPFTQCPEARRRQVHLRPTEFNPRPHDPTMQSPLDPSFRGFRLTGDGRA